MTLMSSHGICLPGKFTDRRRAVESTRLLARAEYLASGLEVAILAGALFLVLNLLGAAP